MPIPIRCACGNLLRVKVEFAGRRYLFTVILAWRGVLSARSVKLPASCRRGFGEMTCCREEVGLGFAG